MADLNDIKLAIWSHRRINRNIVDLQVYADKAGVTLPITEIGEAEKLLKSLTRKVKLKASTPKWCIERYEAAHKAHFQLNYPHCWADNHYLGMEPEWPDVGTGNGLNRMMVEYLTWMGHRATRINVQGRLIETQDKQASGNILTKKKYIKSSTRTGAADVSSTIHGRSCQWEGKVGRDTPKPDQLREQALERKAGGVYEFIFSPEQFFQEYDKVIAGISKQGSIFV